MKPTRRRLWWVLLGLIAVVGSGCATATLLPPQINPTAIDARWASYDPYLQRMVKAVRLQWARLLNESKTYPTSGSKVSVKFVINAKGEIAKIVNVDSTANDGASRACMSAITDRAPYGDWTEDMKAVLGEQQEMTFTFYYQ